MKAHNIILAFTIMSFNQVFADCTVNTSSIRSTTAPSFLNAYTGTSPKIKIFGNPVSFTVGFDPSNVANTILDCTNAQCQTCGSYIYGSGTVKVMLGASAGTTNTIGGPISIAGNVINYQGSASINLTINDAVNANGNYTWDCAGSKQGIFSGSSTINSTISGTASYSYTYTPNGSNTPTYSSSETNSVTGTAAFTAGATINVSGQDSISINVSSINSYITPTFFTGSASGSYSQQISVQ
jgi:hypothetical protein